MNKRGKIIVSILSVILILFVFQVQITSSKENNSPQPNTAFAESTVTGKGGATVPITTTELADQGKDYDINPSRLKFEFNGKPYAIQLRRIKQDNVEFLVMKLDKNKLDDITAHTMDYPFKLVPGEENEIDIDQDGIKDISVKLKGINNKGRKSVQFFVKKIR